MDRLTKTAFKSRCFPMDPSRTHLSSGHRLRGGAVSNKQHSILDFWPSGLYFLHWDRRPRSLDGGFAHRARKIVVKTLSLHTAIL